MAGRFAPSPTSRLHVGNLRTAVLAWLFARSTGRAFRVRIEDLDTVRVAAAADVARGQLADLAALGLDWDGEVVWQSERLEAYEAAVARLGDGTYECFCTRRDIAEAATAPHADGYRPYPGTCRDLSDAERERRRSERPPALRVRGEGARVTIVDRYAGEVTREVDDFVIRRSDGVFAYNLAAVTDDVAQGVDQVVRGDDLLSSSPRQAWLVGRLGGHPPLYAHVPLAVNEQGVRLAKRDGAVTLEDLAARGVGPREVLSRIACSAGLASPGEPVTVALLLARFDPEALPRAPWVVTGDWSGR